MSDKRRHPLRRLLKTSLNLDRPAPRGTVLGTLVAEEEFERLMPDADLPYPPLAEKSPGCSFDAETRELRADVWGRVRFGAEGIRVEPAWFLNKDKTLLTVEADGEDCLGAAVSAGRLLAVLPPGLEDVPLDHEALNKALAEAARSGKPVPAVMARGRLPKSGTDGKLRLLFSPKQSAGSLREDGTMDFRERGGLHCVAEGEPLAELVPPVPGEPGVDVFGSVLAPAEPRAASVKAGKGVTETPREDGWTVYSAAIGGVAHFSGGILTVSELLTIEGDVDMRTGHVRSKQGSVRITGSVRSGFQVESPGDIIVDGLVEEADLTAGGGIAVAGGVIMNHKNTLTAGGNVSARFFQNARVAAGGDVTAKTEISHCEVKAGGRVLVTSAKGAVSGGAVECGEGVQAAYLGNEARSKTRIVVKVQVGGDEISLEWRNALALKLTRLDQAIGSEDALGALMNSAEEDRRILAELIKIRGRVQADIRAEDDRLAEERKKLEAMLAEKRVKAWVVAHSGVVVVMGAKRMALTEDMDMPVFRWDPDKRTVVAD